MKLLKAVIVHFKLPVHQHWYVVFFSKFIYFLHGRRIAFNAKLELSDHFGAEFQVFFYFLSSISHIRHLTDSESKFITMILCKFVTGLIAISLSLQTVSEPIMRSC